MYVLYIANYRPHTYVVPWSGCKIICGQKKETIKGAFGKEDAPSNFANKRCEMVRPTGAKRQKHIAARDDGEKALVGRKDLQLTLSVMNKKIMSVNYHCKYRLPNEVITL